MCVESTSCPRPAPSPCNAGDVEFACVDEKEKTKKQLYFPKNNGIFLSVAPLSANWSTAVCERIIIAQESTTELYIISNLIV